MIASLTLSLALLIRAFKGFYQEEEMDDDFFPSDPAKPSIPLLSETKNHFPENLCYYISFLIIGIGQYSLPYAFLVSCVFLLNFNFLMFRLLNL